MHVIATAGHVDHGKSTLVQALTGQDPDRLAEERRRGLSIQLGYCWTRFPGVGDVAFVDVPGHERFVSTMLTGIVPVPAALLVVAADDPWMPQAAEHLAALDSLDVRHGLVVVSRADLADPAPMLARARQEVAQTSLRGVESVVVSATTGLGLDVLRSALVRMIHGLPRPDPDAAVRLWVDRRFHVHGTGTVVTATLPSGTVRRGDLLEFEGRAVRVRGVESLGQPAEAVSGVARIALDLGSRVPENLGRGSVLVTPGAYEHTGSVDVRLTGPGPFPPERPVLHVGAASFTIRARRLSETTARLSLERPLPLRIGDRALLRDPGSRTVWGVQVLAPDPPPLRRRGAAAQRGRQLEHLDGSLRSEVLARGLVRADHLTRLGVDVRIVDEEILVVGDVLISTEHADHLRTRIAEEVRDRATPLRPGVPTAAVAHALGVPVPVVATLAAAPVREQAGELRAEDSPAVPPLIAAGWDTVRGRLLAHPYDAPDANQLADLALDRTALAYLAKAGLALRLTDQVVLLPGAEVEAARRLAVLPQPFTLSDARQSLGTSRRVAVPLLEHLDRLGLTVRHPDSTRSVAPTPPPDRPVS